MCPSSTSSVAVCIRTLKREISVCSSHAASSQKQLKQEPKQEEEEEFPELTLEEAVTTRKQRTLLEAAEAVAAAPLPAARGAVKQDIMLRRPAASARCNAAESKLLGQIKLVLATAQSYILQKKANKWSLVVSVTDKMTQRHAEVATKLFHVAQERKIDKEGLVAERLLLLRNLEAPRPSAPKQSRRKPMMWS